jgi:hypothetical protein
MIIADGWAAAAPASAEARVDAGAVRKHQLSCPARSWCECRLVRTSAVTSVT